MGWLVASLVTLTLVFSAATPDGGVCHLHNYVSSCVLNILEEHIEATAIINHCHVPFDITFLIVYQYQNSTRHSWKYTFVTSNQNERVLIPGLLLPSAPHAPVFLYARVPEKEFNMHNSSFVAIQASFIAELGRDKWEEADFLNHTVFISPSSDCHFSRDGKDPVPWIIGGLFGIALLSGLLGGGYHLYRKRKMAADQLALVSAMEVGMPGAQPYQMDTVVEQTVTGEPSSQEPVTGNGSTTSETIDSIMKKAKPPDQGANEEEPSGRKGFKFGRLREETSFQGNAAELEDPSVIIANPAYEEENHQIQKQVEMIKQEQADKFSLSSQDQKFTQGGGIVNRMYQDELDAPHQWQEDEERNQEVLDEVTCDDCKVETSDSLEGCSQVGQGARRKVRGAVSSSTMVTAKAGGDGDSQKCL